jgi:hypothetical protein
MSWYVQFKVAHLDMFRKFLRPIVILPGGISLLVGAGLGAIGMPMSSSVAVWIAALLAIGGTMIVYALTRIWREPDGIDPGPQHGAIVAHDDA